MLARVQFALWCGLAVAGLTAIGCGRSTGGVRMEGSDTMVNVAQAWAEAYRREHPDVSVQVLGGGSGVGIASLIDGNCDLANASRKIEPKEEERMKTKRGVAAQEHVVGYDALAIYVHKDNPLETISIEELAELYGEDGKISKWSQLDVDSARFGGKDTITRVSRQNSSGTYAYFREHVLGTKRDYKLGSISANGSKDVVAMVSATPNAIGYSGMGYATAEVKMLKVSAKKGQSGVAPSVGSVKDGAYPITRPLLIYTPGELEGEARQFLGWIKGKGGQKALTAQVYVPEHLHD